MLPSLGEYFNAKNQKWPSFPSRDIHDQRILHDGWIRTFWSVTSEAECSEIKGLHNKTKTSSFCFRLLPTQSNNKILWKLKKTPLLPISWNTRIFLEDAILELFVDFYSWGKFPKKLIYRFWEKLVTDRYTDRDARRSISS